MRYYFTLLCAICFFSANAGIEVYSSRLENFSTNDDFEVYDTKYFDMQSNLFWASEFSNYKVTNRVRLGYKKDAMLQTNESADVTLNITSWEYSTSLNAFTTVNYSEVLSVYFDNDGTLIMDDQSTFSFENGHRILVEITGIAGTVTDLYLESFIEVERYYTFDPSPITTYGYNAINYTTTASGFEPTQDPVTYLFDPRIEFWWEEVYGAEWYDLEWTVVSDVDYDTYTETILEAQESALSFDFYMNATRVRIRNNFYEIPGSFNKGHIVYRVRAVGKQGSNFEYDFDGQWSYSETGTVATYNAQTASGSIKLAKDFEEDRNWEYAVTYTENGKRTEGISYTDGLGRSRQSISHNTVTDQAIISNSYYDKVGRKVLTDLPTPDDNENLSFRPEFNYVIVSSQEDPLTTANMDQIGTCDLGLPFSDNYGAGRYYSSTNPNQDGASNYIPDAQDYPYARITYVSDPTGRIRETGAAGLEHQVSNYTTRYMYETPKQDELNELFGTEAGWNSHYQKKVAIDENGQAYINYYDMAGRTVASGLAGDSPTNLVELDNNTGGSSETEIVYTYLKDNNADPTIAQYSYSKVMLNAGNFLLDHNFDPAIFEDQTCINGICFDCHYDFEIKIERTDCPQETPEYSYSTPINGTTINQACNIDPYATGTTIDITLDPGEYVITKSLKLADGMAQQYWCEYADNSTCMPDFYTLYEEIYDDTDFGCTPINLQLAALDECDMRKQLMIQDMAVGGQYGEVYDQYGSVTGSISTSIYNESNILPTGYSWRDPITPYVNNNGTPARIYLTQLFPAGTYDPQPQSGATIYYDQGNPYILPEDLANLSDFVEYSQMAWGESLIEYHPEYCYLEFCETEGRSFHEFTDNLESTETFDDACSDGLFAPLGSTTLSVSVFSSCSTNPFPEDAFFSSGYFSGTVAQWVEDNYPCIPVMGYGTGDALDDYYLLPDNTNYLSIWEYAVWQATCGDEFVYNDIISCISNATLDDCDEDQVWFYFRDAYLKLRQEAYLFAQAAYVSYPDSYTGGGCGYSNNQCIGFEDFYGSSFSSLSSVDCFDPDEYLDTPNSPVDLSSETNSEPCNDTDGAAFDNKMPRFLNFFNDTELSVPASFTSDPEQYTTDQLETICQQSCELQAYQWMEALEGCNLTQEQFDNIKDGLIEVCIAGCDETNIMGASDLQNAPNVNTGSPNYYTSFEAVLIDVLGTNYENALCSDLLISSPYPYGQNFQQTTSTDVDYCACDKIMKADYDLTNNPVTGISTLEEMLAYNEGIQVPMAKALLCHCEAAFDGTWTPTSTWNSTSLSNLSNNPVPVPMELSCTPQDCETCTDVDNLYDDFITEFGSGVVSQPTFEVLLKNYLNINLGFNLSYTDYEFFMEACDATSSDPMCQLTAIAPVFENLIDLIARRGQLTSTSSVSLTDNVVYQYSDIGLILGSSTYSSSISNDVLTMTFGSNTVDITLPTSADFTFDEIISLNNISPIPCGSNSAFTIEATILRCGLLEYRTLTGSSSDITLTTCYCGSTSPELCNFFSLPLSGEDCYLEQLIAINGISIETYLEQIDDMKDIFISDYTSTCATAFQSETMEETSNRNNYQFTLYYYDQAGNLIQTVAPKGVDLSFQNSLSYPDVDADRTQGTTANVPTHSYVTTYAYNSYNEVVSADHPDQNGSTSFWYDRYGRLVASQNPVQAGENKYSYSLYDQFGRPVETGQVVPLTTLTEVVVKADDLGASFGTWVSNGTQTEIIKTQYDQSLGSAYDALFDSGEQENLRLRVASVMYYPVEGSPTSYESAIHYSYNEHGSVKEQIQEVPMMAPVQQDVKSTLYEFELLSGNMSRVIYQKDKQDQFTHEFYYDELGRPEEVFTTSDNVHKTREVHYRYYDHGPLARIELGDDKVQGMDYAYTINGWIKATNASTLNTSRDIGKDGTTGYAGNNNQIHAYFAKDVIGNTIGYFGGDYTAIGTSTMEATYGATDAFNTGGLDLFNGNIRHIVTSIEGFLTGGQPYSFGTNYSYDQLNRFKEMTAYYNTNTTNDWTGISATSDYYNVNEYDENGNLESLKRNTNISGGYMDDFVYNYNANSNQLNNVVDNATNTLIDGTGGDIVANPTTGQPASYYTYDANGELLTDSQESIGNIEWRRGDRKVKKITRSDQDSPEIEFVYNPLGMRIVKIVKPRSSGSLTQPSNWVYTYYAYDANGEVMAVYDARLSTSHNEATLEEVNIFGAARIGQYEADKLLFDDQEVNYGNPTTRVNTKGIRRYELTNHQGNVNAVINDRKMYNTTDNVYEATILMTSDYYPYGMVMSGRKTNTNLYRYGYQDQEVDDEIKGDNNSVNYAFRMHDPRLGRFFAIDPLMAKYPHNSPYAFSENRLLDGIELEGLEWQRAGKNHEFFGGTYDQETRSIIPEDGTKSAYTDLDGYSYSSSSGVIFDNQTGVQTGATLNGELHHNGTHIATYEQIASMDADGKLTGYSYNVTVHALSGDLFYENVQLMSYNNGFWNYNYSISSLYSTRMSIDYSSTSYYRHYDNTTGDIRYNNGFLTFSEFFLAPVQGGLEDGLVYSGMDREIASYTSGALMFVGGLAMGKFKSGSGGLNLYKYRSWQALQSSGWKKGDYFLNLPNQGSPKLNWKQNYGALRMEMRLGRPIYDSYIYSNGNLIPTKGFLNAERYTLQTRGWNYNPKMGAWMPPR